MKKLISLLLCLLVSIFAMALTMKPSHTLAAIAKTAQTKPTGQKADAKDLLDDANKALAENESFDMSEAEQQEVAAEENSGEEVASDDVDSIEDASDHESEDVTDDDGGDNDSGDDGGGDDGGGDEDN